jgi:hypothetical protein
VEDSLDATMPIAVDAVQQARTLAKEGGWQLAAGLAPGKARVFQDTRRPARGWEIAGPFYLVRWMMNLSAHRGRLLMTQAGAKLVPRRGAERLGRVAIEEGKYIHLFELA